MTGAEIASGRLRHQLIEGDTATSPADVVRTLAAMQGLDYLASLWAVALRTADATEHDVEASIARRELVRTWPMRGTLHLVAAEDARWMTELMAPKVIKRMAARHRQPGLDQAVFDRGRAALTEALQGDRQPAPAGSMRQAMATRPTSESSSRCSATRLARVRFETPSLR